jgi:hypothetical protein
MQITQGVKVHGTKARIILNGNKEDTYNIIIMTFKWIGNKEDLMLYLS